MNDLEQPKRGTESGETPEFGVRSSEFGVASISSALAWIKHFFDYLGASREEPPPGAGFLASPLWLGIWWGLLIGLILLFCGQTSKFIYIDF
jgi:hypothetical protein